MDVSRNNDKLVTIVWIKHLVTNEGYDVESLLETVKCQMGTIEWTSLGIGSSIK